MRQISARLASAAAVALLAGALAAPGDAQAQSRAVVVTDLNLRAGPSTAYPVLAVLPEGLPVVVNGCVRDLSWCDIDVGWERGWVSARFLAAHDRRRPVYQVAPIITFEWPFFGERRDPRYAAPPRWREERRHREERRRWDGFRDEFRAGDLDDDIFEEPPAPPPRRQHEADRGDVGERGERPRSPRGGALSGGDFFE